MRSRSVPVVTVLLASHSTRSSLLPLQRLIPHLVHPEGPHVPSVVARSVGLVEVGAAGRHRALLVILASVAGTATVHVVLVSVHSGRRTGLSGHFAVWWPLRRGVLVIVALVVRSLMDTRFGAIVSVEVAIGVGTIHQFAVAARSMMLLVVRVVVLGVLGTLVEMSTAVIHVPSVVVSWC